MSPILLDTHAAIWAVEGTLTPRLRTLIDSAADRDELLLSPISAWEIGMLVAKHRLTLTMTVDDYVRALFSGSGTLQATLTPAIAAAATALPGSPPRDPADRILVATAAAYGARFVTRDRVILGYAQATQHIRCVKC